MKKINSLFALLLFYNIVFSQTYFIETFDDNEASGWTFEDLWTIGDFTTMPGLNGGNVHNSTFLGFDDFSAGQNHMGGGMAITPIIDLTSASSPLFMEVLVKFRNADQFGINERFKMLVSTDNGDSWEEYIEFDEPDWEKQIFDFDQYVGESIQVAFEYTDGNGYNIGAAIDDVAISNDLVFSQPLEYTLTVDSGAMFSECAENIDYQVTGVVLNYGTETISSFDLLVDSGNETNTFSFQSDIKTNEIFRYSIPETLNTGSSPSSYTISITNINNSIETDSDETDNSWEIAFEPVSTVEGKGVLLEEGTGAWCGQCTRGTVFLGEISKRFGNQVASVAVHNSDPMAISEYDQAIQDQGVFGYPSVVFNREEIIDPDEVVMPVIEELSFSAIADIDVSGQENINDFAATVKVTFNEAINNANHNVSVILTEDNLSNSNENWNQWNSYSQSSTHMGGFEFFPSFMPSSYWPYDHVGRALIGAFEGVNVINGNYENGASVSHTFEPYTIPLGWDKDKLKVIAVLTDENGEVVNVISKKYEEVLSNDIPTNINDLIDEPIVEVYPNPTSSWLTVDLNTQEKLSGILELRNIIGQSILTEQLETIGGEQQVRLDLTTLPKGVYILQIILNGKKINKKITVQ